MKKRIDNLHCDFSPIDGRDKPINEIITARHDGKTTMFMLSKVLPRWRKNREPFILMFRNIADIKPSAIQYYAELMNPFLDEDERIELRIAETKCKDGIVPAFVGNDVFCYAVALSLKEQTLKKTAFPKCSLILFDEYEINPRNGERYLKNEFGKMKAFFDTQRKVSNARMYLLTNPYSKSNPLHSGLGIDTSKIKLGEMLVGENYAIWYKRMNPLLVESLKKSNPLFSESDAYGKMAFSGEFSDDESMIMPFPANFHFACEVNYYGIRYGIYRNRAFEIDGDSPYYYIKKETHAGARRKSFAFSFDDLVVNGSLYVRGGMLSALKSCLAMRMVGFDSLEASEFAKDVYNYL